MTRPEILVLQTLHGGNVHLSCSTQQLRATYTGPKEYTLFLALSVQLETPRSDAFEVAGSPVVPYAQGFEGSTVFLPFAADRLYCVAADRCWARTWSPLQWGDRTADCPGLLIATAPNQRELTLSWPPSASQISIAVYLKDLRQNHGWGSLVASCDPSLAPAIGDAALNIYFEATAAGNWELQPVARFHSSSRERIYELFVRLFGNTNPRRKPDGSLVENGCGKFADITATAISQIAAMGFTHIWLMGAVRHATTTGYNLPGLQADQTDLMKGLAGSPYAIKDYFDVAPDLALDPARRLQEFGDLLARIHAAGLKVLIDFVGNHVSRAYQSTLRPDLSFGLADNPAHFFLPANNFFYLGPADSGGGPPLRLPTFNRETRQPISPTCAVKQDCDGLFPGETTLGRVTGNNCLTWTPSLQDWYETVKLNYGFEFTGRFLPQRAFPHAADLTPAIPDTWVKMDAVLAHWQQLGVDGFRCDMAHMLPPEFWTWSIHRARCRNRQVFFMAEAYNDYFTVPTTAPEVLALGNQPLFPSLLRAGFNAVYGHDVYRVLKEIYDGVKWANDIDAVLGPSYVLHHSVHYLENHDEVRVASPYGWSGLGPRVGRAASAILYGLAAGPVLFYNGQEVGERAVEAEGFSGADGRTTLFDYWCLPELSKWVNKGAFDGGQLSGEQQELRAFYSRLVTLCGREVFQNGAFFSLNPSNVDNPAYGRIYGETASGHWLYAFLRYDRASQQRVCVVANLHDTHEFSQPYIRLTDEALRFLDLGAATPLRLSDLLQPDRPVIQVNAASQGILVPKLRPLTPCYFNLEPVA